MKTGPGSKDRVIFYCNHIISFAGSGVDENVLFSSLIYVMLLAVSIIQLTLTKDFQCLAYVLKL